MLLFGTLDYGMVVAPRLGGDVVALANGLRGRFTCEE
jgi:hypothetical protein